MNVTADAKKCAEVGRVGCVQRRQPMPSSKELARKLLEKQGWKQGMGLGAENTGISTYVRVVKPRAKKGEAFGLGHEANFGTENTDMGFDATLASIDRKVRRKERKAGRHGHSADSDDGATTSTDSAEDRPLRKRRHLEGEHDIHSPLGGGTAAVATEAVPAMDGEAKKEKKTKKPRKVVSSSDDSSSDSEGDGFGTAGGLQLDDAALFAKCNGVRLGRGGRHRFFDGKLARADKHNKDNEGVDPYEGKGVVNKKKLDGASTTPTPIPADGSDSD